MIDTKLDLLHADSDTLSREAVKVLLEHKARAVAMFCVKGKSAITDYYINVTAGSTTQVAALADILDEKLSERGCAARRIEGRRENTWLLVDYGDLIVNVFIREAREFYDLDRLFSDNDKVDITPYIDEVNEKLGVQ